ncbi:MAG: alpha-L-fucosidase [Armatimonadota bacterium]
MNKARKRAREKFREMRFGLFVHWGVYSVLGRGEWVMHNENIPKKQYQKLVLEFNPTQFNADKWVSMTKSVGKCYITVTAKHYDGFCMYDSHLTDYKITNTSYKKDPIAALAKACQKHKIALLLYYSPLDWFHPAYETDWETYTRHWHWQVLELFRKYSPFGIWLDGCWHKPERLDSTWKLTQLYQEIRKIAPGAIIANNHHQAPLPEEDVQTFEQDLPGENTAGFNPTTPAEDALHETCMTVNNSWGYNANDHNHQSTEELIRILSSCAGLDANLLLNIGSQPDGTIQPEFVERLNGIGKWIKQYGQAVYQTRGRIVPEQQWGTLTHGGNCSYIYIHLWEAPSTLRVRLPALPKHVRKAYWLSTKQPLSFTQDANAVEIRIPKFA